MKPSKVSKKITEEARKKEDEQAAAVAFEEYVATFQDTNKASKVWVKAGTYDAGRREEDTKEKGKLYKPTSRYESSSSSEVKEERVKKKAHQQEKKKSNLEIFKEELKIIQEEREERHRLKKMLGLQEVIKLPPKPGDDLRASLSLELDDVKTGSIDDGDPNTTNIYLGNLPTKISEQQLMEIFGKFGPLASVKVMWPRTDEEKARNRLSGFVAFMSRRDGERALKHLAGKEILNAEVKLGWGKAVPIPAFPIYIPPKMMELTMPPVPSGLPFNAQKNNEGAGGRERNDDDFERVVFNAVVKVVIPTDRSLLCLIHRMVEFVAREGPMFEAMIMNREINNPLYRFLFENQGPAHIYYRWKLFSILQGDSTQRWRTEDFRMFKNGSVWRPPGLNTFTMGMPDELIPEDEREIRKGTLSNAQRTRIEKMLRGITASRHKIAEVMIFSIEHSEAISEISECIKESLSNPKTALQKKIARLYIISDVLYNCSLKSMNAFGYRKGFLQHLPGIFQEIHYAYQTASGNGAECFRERVMAVCKAWEEWEIYPKGFIERLIEIFEGGISVHSKEEEEKIMQDFEEEDDVVLRKRRKSPPRAQLPPKSAINLVRSLQNVEQEHEDIDGIPFIEEEEAVVQQQDKKAQSGGFMPSKWETVDPEDVKAGAVTTTSKWDLFEEDIDGVPMEMEDSSSSGGANELATDAEEKRMFLRDVELKVLAYQDEIENGGGGSGASSSVSEMVEDYRRTLLLGGSRERGGGDARSSSSSRSRKSRRRSSTEEDRDRDRRRRSRSRSRSKSKESKSRSRSRSHRRKHRR